MIEIKNKKAYFDYFVLREIETGIERDRDRDSDRER